MDKVEERTSGMKGKMDELEHSDTDNVRKYDNNARDLWAPLKEQN